MLTNLINSKWVIPIDSIKSACKERTPNSPLVETHRRATELKNVNSLSRR